MLSRLPALILQRFREWDRPAQVALALVIILILIVLALGLAGPVDLRQPALIGLIGLFIMAQIIIMWANRGMVTPYTQAQRRYLAGDLEAARDLLEAVRASGRADVRDLTLLGNTYRQLGDLTRSEEVLLEALDIRPEGHFPLYGYGRTLLAKGQYAEAAETIRRALDNGAPPVVNIDLAEALYRAGDTAAARAGLAAGADLAGDPYRQLMVAFLRGQLAAGEPPTPSEIEAGTSVWEATAARFSHTAYGRALERDLQTMRHYTQEA